MKETVKFTRSAWIDKDNRVVSFSEQEGFQKIPFHTQEDRLQYVFHLAVLGYKVT